MVNNQTEFNNKYTDKTITEVEIKRNRNFQGELIIEDYSELQKLNLRDIKSIEKIILKNLADLQEVTIWNCGLQDLIVENCPNIKTLNLCSNNLINLKFLKNLSNLQKLQIDKNKKISSGIEFLPDNLKEFSYDLTGLFENLKSYNHNWKLCQEDLLKSKEKIFNVEEFLFLQKKQETLETKYKNLKNQASSLLNHIKKGGALDQDETKEIMFKLENEVKELKINKEDLEKELVKLKEEGQGKVKLLGSKKKELEDLKKTIISENDLGEDDLDDILEDQENVSKNPNEKTIKKLERTKKRFLKLITESEINQLCQLQSEITNLEIDLGKIEQRIINVQGNAFLGNITTGDNANFGNINVQNNNSAIQEQNNYDSKQTEIESLMVQEPKSNNPPF